MYNINLFGKSIWTIDGETVKMFGILPFTTRMTVVRLESGELWIHSPIAPARGIFSAVDSLGKVEYLIAPNKIHSLGIKPWKNHYPSARVWGSPQFNQRHPDIILDGCLNNDTVPPWKNDIMQHAVGGHAFLDEVVFLHKASATLIITDLIQKHDPQKQSLFWRVVKGMAGVLGKSGGVPLDLQLSFRDKEKARSSLDTILDWNFDNLIISHGFCMQGGAKKEVERRFSWLLK